MTDDPILERERDLARRLGKVPFPYQRVDARWLAKRRRGLLFHDPGLGKTWIWLLALPAGAPVVVACPAVAKGKWADEIRQVRPDFRPTVLEGRRMFRWARAGEIVITNWESLPPSHAEHRRAMVRVSHAKRGKAKADALRELRRIHRIRFRFTVPPPGTIVVGDEIHRAKTATTAVTKRWRELSALALHYGGRSWGGTGTPLVNRSEELYTILQASGLGERAFGGRDAFLELAEHDEAEFTRRMRLVSIRRQRQDVLPDLPPKVREILPVELSTITRARCDQLVEAMRREGIPLDRLTLEGLHRLRDPKHPLRDHVSVVRALLAEAKMPAVLELLDELRASKTPVVVASAHRGPVDAIARRKGATRISGSEAHEEKYRRAQAFQDGLFDVVAGTYRVFGEAIDLFRAWRGICVDLPWTVASIEQFESRLQRIGQKAEGLLFTRVVADHPLERRVEELLRQKQEAAERLVERGKRPAV